MSIFSYSVKSSGSNVVVVNGKVVSGSENKHGKSSRSKTHILSEGCGAFSRIEISLPHTDKVNLKTDESLFGAEAKVTGAREKDIIMEVSNGILSVRESDRAVGCADSVELRVPEQTYDKLSASTMSGDITVEGVGCVKLVLDSMSGDISIVSGEFVECHAETMSGDVDVDMRAIVDTDVDIETMSGNVRMRTSNVELCAVDTSTMSGHVSVNRRTPAVTGGTVLRGKVSTMSGNIDID